MAADENAQDEPQTALLLTEQEWVFLAEICLVYVLDHPKTIEHGALARRIIEAAESPPKNAEEVQ